MALRMIAIWTTHQFWSLRTTAPISRLLATIKSFFGLVSLLTINCERASRCFLQGEEAGRGLLWALWHFVKSRGQLLYLHQHQHKPLFILRGYEAMIHLIWAIKTVSWGVLRICIQSFFIRVVRNRTLLLFGTITPINTNKHLYLGYLQARYIYQLAVVCLSVVSCAKSKWANQKL